MYIYNYIYVTYIELYRVNPDPRFFLRIPRGGLTWHDARTQKGSQPPEGRVPKGTHTGHTQTGRAPQGTHTGHTQTAQMEIDASNVGLDML